MFALATGNKSDRATMFYAIGIGVDPFMPVRRDAEQNGPGKSGHRQRSSEASSAVPRIHCVGIFERLQELRKRYFRRLPS
jgi:hypothetical protein